MPHDLDEIESSLGSRQAGEDTAQLRRKPHGKRDEGTFVC